MGKSEWSYQVNLSEKIQFLRQQGYTQSQIEARTGITQSSVSRIESGIQNSVQYHKGIALDDLLNKVKQQTKPKHKELNHEPIIATN